MQGLEVCTRKEANILMLNGFGIPDTQRTAESDKSGSCFGDFASRVPDQPKSDVACTAKFIAATYSELRQKAARYLKHERFGRALDAAELVHEAYLRMGTADGTWENKVHFIRSASRVMRHILIEHARARLAQKREGDLEPVPLGEALALTPGPSTDSLAIRGLVTRLKERNQRIGRIVELRFFEGLTAEETATELNVSVSTVKSGCHIAMTRLRGHWEARRTSPRPALLEMLATTTTNHRPQGRPSNLFSALSENL